MFSTPGDIIFWGIRQVICLFYDDMIALNTGNRFAKMCPEETKRFAVEGRKMWAQPGSIVTVEVVEADDEGVSAHG